MSFKNHFTPKIIISLVVTFFASSVLSYIFFPVSAGMISPQGGDSSSPTIDPGEPKTEMCPLNGALYTKTEEALWEQRRPLVVMIENHSEARPQSGLSKADIVYEAVAEGGITRFMAVFYCDAAFGDLTIGPVRSARTYFLDWASEYSSNPVYVHVGGANTPGKADALGQIVDYGWGGENDFNQFGLSVNECAREYARTGETRATEHTMYCYTEALWDLADTRGWAAAGEDGDAWDDSYTAWEFAKKDLAGADPATSISFDFWDDFSQYTVEWNYDSAQGVYVRNNGGKEHIDFNTGQALTATTVIVQFVTETGPIDDLKHMLYGTIDDGTALAFTQGQVEELTWEKSKRTARTTFYYEDGDEYQFQPGKIWIEAIPKGNSVDY